MLLGIMFLILHLLCCTKLATKHLVKRHHMNKDDCDDAGCSILTGIIFNPNTVSLRKFTSSYILFPGLNSFSGISAARFLIKWSFKFVV